MSKPYYCPHCKQNVAGTYRNEWETMFKQVKYHVCELCGKTGLKKAKE